MLSPQPPQKLVITRTFDSLEQALVKIETEPYNKDLLSANSRSSVTGDFEFTQTNSLPEAIALARNGWPLGNEIISKLTKEHSEMFIKLFPKQDWAIQLLPDVAGETINMDAVLTGQPETMMHFDVDQEKLQKNQAGKMQRIIIDTEFPWFIKPDTIFNRGAIVCSMINTMELSGFRTELWVTNCRHSINADVNSRVTYYYKIKSFDEDLNLNKLSFVACHPSMLRRIQFALLEQEPYDYIPAAYIYSGYGVPADITKEEIEKFGGELQYGNIYFEKLDDNRDFATLLADTKVKIEKHFSTIKI